MECKHLQHRNGGKITHLYEVVHETWRGVASWWFRGRVEWHDGGVSDPAPIHPNAICTTDTPDSQFEVNAAMRALNEYLRTSGKWHAAKHKRDGRCYHWTPYASKGAQRI